MGLQAGEGFGGGVTGSSGRVEKQAAERGLGQDGVKKNARFFQGAQPGLLECGRIGGRGEEQAPVSFRRVALHAGQFAEDESGGEPLVLSRSRPDQGPEGQVVLVQGDQIDIVPDLRAARGGENLVRGGVPEVQAVAEFLVGFDRKETEGGIIPKWKLRVLG